MRRYTTRMSEASDQKPRRLTGDRRKHAIERAQDLMASAMPYPKVVGTLAGEYECSRSAAEKVVTEARKAWRDTEGSRDRDEHRDLHRAITMKILQSALGRRRIERAKGRPIRDAEGRYVTYPDPDYRTALRACETLARLDGTFQQRIELEAEGSIERFVERLATEFQNEPELLERMLPLAKTDG